jgi:hypothetical protein
MAALAEQPGAARRSAQHGRSVDFGATVSCSAGFDPVLSSAGPKCR